MKEIGGYFELELPTGKGCHKSAVRVNNGRNGLVLLLRANNISCVLVPYYLCDSVLAKLKECGFPYEFYSLDEDLKPVVHRSVRRGEALLYVNYFGIGSHAVKEVVRDFGKSRIIVDNSQAFYAKPVAGVATFYSARKFFGVADGGYIYSPVQVQGPIDVDTSVDRYTHLLGRIDVGAQRYYDAYRENEERHDGLSVRGMSKLTRRILESVDHDRVQSARKKNFGVLHELLGDINNLTIADTMVDVPMVYPLLLDAPGLKKFLIDNKVFVPTYWPDVLGRLGSVDAVERRLVNELTCLPIDQRYGKSEMQAVGRLVRRYIESTLTETRK